MAFRCNKLFLAVLFCISFSFANAQVFWTETFTNGCTTGCAAFTGANGAWAITSTGTNGAKANTWYFSCAENGNAAGTCGTGCGNDASLHIGNVAGSPAAAFFCPGGDCGAAYDATNAQVVTNKRAESPAINCTGKSNISVSFNYIEKGQGTSDDASFWYYDGAAWAQLNALAKTATGAGCGSQGFWTAITISLPASANNNANVKIGINWTNNGDGTGSDPSIAVDDITVSAPAGGNAPVAAFTISDNTICPSTCITFTDQSTNTPTSWSWTFSGGNPSTSSSQNPGSVCYSSSGTYTVTLTATNTFGNNSTSQTITVFSLPTPNAGADTNFCANSSVQLNATGGALYFWSPTIGLNNTTSATPIASPTATTTYTVTCTNAEGCSSADAVIVTVNQLQGVSVSPSAFSLCKGQGTQLTASGASTYTWSPSAGLSGTSGSSVFAIPNSSTNYTVTGINALGCTASAISAITVHDQPFVIASITNDSPCPGSGAIVVSIIGGNPPYNFIWNTGATTQNLTNIIAGNYTLTVTSGPCSVVTTYTVSAGTYSPTLTVTNLYSCSARLNWTATPSASYYKVRYKITGSTTWSPVVTLGNVLFYDFTGLASNTTYTFQVAAFCSSNQNLGWKAKSGKTQICTSPINPSITNLTSTSATISWNSACSPTNFLFQYRKVGVTSWTSITTVNTSVILNNLINATSYEFRIRSGCGAGVNSAFTAIQTFTTAPRLEDTEVENSFRIFPNPNNGSFMLELPALFTESLISIYNITGQLVYSSNLAASQNPSSQKILLKNISDGLYEVVLTNEIQRLTQRLIIQK